jgi:Ser/Thr protein kinase RdoA (MazF antagonist)
MALKSDPPVISRDDVNNLTLQQYGLKGRFQSLPGERDANFLFHVDGGGKLILKFSHAAEDPAVLDFQCQALLHIEAQDPGLPVPRVYPTLNGDNFQTVKLEGGEQLILRAQTCIDGVPFSDGNMSLAKLRQTGIVAARLDLALSGFSHPAARQQLAWDLVNARQLLPCTPAIVDNGVRDLIEQVLQHFTTVVVPKLTRLRAQVIHADLHFGNMHTGAAKDSPISGIVDFGDMLQAPLVVEVCTALAEVATCYDEPMPAMASLLAGYESLLPLQVNEYEVLHSCTMTRLAITYVIFSWRLANQGSLSPIYDGFEETVTKAIRTLHLLSQEEFLSAIQTGN